MQWRGKHLSKEGREVLVTLVAQFIPTYCMSTFLVLSSLGGESEHMINSSVGNEQKFRQRH